MQARWSRDSREIYDRRGGHLVAVSIRTSAPEPVFGKPVALFADEYEFGQGSATRTATSRPAGAS